MMNKFYDKVAYNFDDSDDETGGNSQKRYAAVATLIIYTTLFYYIEIIINILYVIHCQCTLPTKKFIQTTCSSIFNWFKGMARKPPHWSY